MFSDSYNLEQHMLVLEDDYMCVNTACISHLVLTSLNNTQHVGAEIRILQMVTKGKTQVQNRK